MDVDLYKMQVNRLTLYDIQTALKSENMAFSVGAVRTGEVKQNIRISGQFESVEDIRNLVVRNPSGGAVYLRDVATVQDSADAPAGYALVNGRRAVYILATKRSDASTLSVWSCCNSSQNRSHPP